MEIINYINYHGRIRIQNPNLAVRILDPDSAKTVQTNRIRTPILHVGIGTAQRIQYLLLLQLCARTICYYCFSHVTWINSFHMERGMSGSFRHRRKSLIHPHRTWTSI
jgi:hypothetical protein